MTRGSPWYSFLYRWLGAHGTFWLWLIAPLALWWTFEPAMIRLANRKPHPVEIHSVADRPLARWVTLRGLRLRVDRRLLQQAEAPGLPPVEFLIEPDAPAAVWWERTRALTEPASGLSAIGASGGLGGAFPLLARKRLVRRFAKLRGSPERFLPTPEKAILLLDQAAAPLSSPPAPVAPGTAVSSFFTETELQIERVRERVEPGVTLQGVVGGTPPVLVKRVESELDLPVPEFLLQIDRKPRELESVVFGVAAIVLLFLIVGLYGAKGVPTNDSDEMT
jgi:hypothetical protein